MKRRRFRLCGSGVGREHIAGWVLSPSLLCSREETIAGRLKNGVSRTVWEENGSVYTRPWVVEFILDLCGYYPSENLVDAIAVEPCCGGGEFLEAMARRLSESCRRQKRPLEECADSLVAVDVDPHAVAESRVRVVAVLTDSGWAQGESEKIARRWVREADFLLDPELDFFGELGEGADFVIGNPPYVRLRTQSAGSEHEIRPRSGLRKGRDEAIPVVADGGSARPRVLRLLGGAGGSASAAVSLMAVLPHLP